MYDNGRVFLWRAGTWLTQIKPYIEISVVTVKEQMNNKQFFCYFSSISKCRLLYFQIVLSYTLTSNRPTPIRPKSVSTVTCSWSLCKAPLFWYRWGSTEPFRSHRTNGNGGQREAGRRTSFPLAAPMLAAAWQDGNSLVL